MPKLHLTLFSFFKLFNLCLVTVPCMKGRKFEYNNVEILLGKVLPNKLNHIPELSMGFPAGLGSGSLISTTTQSDIKNVFATDDACSRQHLTT